MNKEIFEKCDTYFNEEIYKFFTEAIKDYIHNDFAYTQTIQPHKIRKPCQWICKTLAGEGFQGSSNNLK